MLICLVQTKWPPAHHRSGSEYELLFRLHDPRVGLVEYCVSVVFSLSREVLTEQNSYGFIVDSKTICGGALEG